MTLTVNKVLLAQLNVYRVQEGKAPFADWRAARHQPMLDAYNAAADARIAEFEASTEELTGQEGRPSTEEVEIVTASAEMTLDEMTEKTIEDATAAADAEVVTETPAEKVKTPSYKDFANYDRSRIMKPVDFVHSFLDAHPELSRKAAVQALVEAGVNYSTARTQYQRWFSKRK